jgi:multidrug resistance efflux pump
MSESFFRSRRLLEGDDSHSWGLGALIATGVLCAWVLWFFLARVAIYRVSDVARLESGGAAYQVQAAVAGRVLSSSLTLGVQVGKGTVLVQLDDEAERRQLQEERTALSAIAPQLAALRQQIKAEEAALAASQQAARVALDQARVQLHGANEALRYAQDRAKRYQAAGMAVAQLDLLRAEAEAQERRTAADAGQLEVARLDRDEKKQERDRTAHIDDLKQQATALQGQIETRTATISRLEYEIEKRRIRAPAAGSLAEVANLRVGGVVGEGERLAAIVPLGTIRAVAEFSPSEALGHIRPGQHAWIRLKGFPWTEYGTIRATVAGVASEIRDGSIRVEFAIDLDPNSPIPFQHGLPGTVEVEVERTSPARLALRAAGQLLAKPAIPKS